MTWREAALLALMPPPQVFTAAVEQPIKRVSNPDEDDGGENSCSIGG